MELDEGMFLEEIVVAIGEIGTVMAAAAFFARESGAGHERCELGFGQVHIFQGCDGGRKFFAAA